ncbi:MAG: alpha-L-glutamate ligase-like protein [Pseudomonadota bacterium]
MFGIVKRLADAGVVGINRRNLDFVMAHNARRNYPLVDDKMRTKQLALDAGMAVPELYGSIATQGDVRRIGDIAADRPFVVKPAHGSGGDGILVIDGKTAKGYRKHDGTSISEGEMAYHASTTLSGQYSLSGLPDTVMIEYRVQFDPLFANIAYQGIPDIRVVVYRGFPTMAMVRLPTRQSGGKANLHQGAIGVGIRIADGVTLAGCWGNEKIVEHPDTGHDIAGIEIPDWETILMLAARSYEITKLGYLGVDIVLDRDRGPLILELNARPGLNIQIANDTGLDSRLARIPADSDLSPAERVAFSVETFANKA